MTIRAKVFIAIVALCGTAVLTHALARSHPLVNMRFLALLIVSLAASRLRVKLPGITGTMSVNLPFVLVAVAVLSVSDSLLIACLSTLVQCMPGAQKRFNTVQAIFNCSNMALAVAGTRLIFDSAAVSAIVRSPSLRMALAASGFLLVNTIPVAIIISLTERAGVVRTWAGMLQLSFPYYVASAGIVGVVLTLNGRIGWQAPVAVLPLMLGLLQSYRRYFSDSSGSAQMVPQPAAAVDLVDVCGTPSS